MFRLLIFFSLFLVSCTTYSDEELESFNQEIESFINCRDLTFTKTEDGLYYNIKKMGSGRNIIFTDSVLISYKGTLLNGKVVDYQKKPVWFAVKDLIAGWKQGLTLVNKEAEIELIVAPQLGYGDRELEAIPKNSILFYELKVFDIR